MTKAMVSEHKLRLIHGCYISSHIYVLSIRVTRESGKGNCNRANGPCEFAGASISLRVTLEAKYFRSSHKPIMPMKKGRGVSIFESL